MVDTCIFHQRMKKKTYMQMFMAPNEDTALNDNIHVCTFNPDKTNST